MLSKSTLWPESGEKVAQSRCGVGQEQRAESLPHPSAGPGPLASQLWEATHVRDASSPWTLNAPALWALQEREQQAGQSGSLHRRSG